MPDDDRLVERWRKPLIPVAVETDPSRARYDAGLRKWVEVVNLTFRKDDVERIRLGYACLRCQEPHETPFPERCFVCGYGMKANQEKDFPLEFDGEKWVGPRTSLDEELTRLEEDTKPRMWHTPGSQILLPRGVNLN